MSITKSKIWYDVLKYVNIMYVIMHDMICYMMYDIMHDMMYGMLHD
jgi:hypothetical protein